MGELAVTAVGADRPGIIARMTRVLSDRGGNLEDGTMTVLSGHFAIMLLVNIDEEPEALQQRLAAATEDLGLTVTVGSVGPADRPAPPTHLLSVYGADRPGILQQVSAVLADANVNITDLTTRLIDGEHSVYAMALEIAVPQGVTEESIREAVNAGVDDVEVSLHPLDAVVL